MNIGSIPLHRLHQLRLDKELSTIDIAQFCIDQIKQYDDQLKCYLSTYFDQTLQQAELADKLLQQGKKIDCLQGMPIAIKDIFSLKGQKTTCGSKILENYYAPFDATVITKLKEKGCAFIGKTNMDEFAMGSSTEHSAFAVTKNPWNTEHVAGGSSGGSAAALAASMCVAAIGTDTGGSIRQPAGFCGVVGLKPTYGTVSRYGMVAFGSSLDQGGPICKDVHDAALLLEAISGHDPYDSTSSKQQLPELVSAIGTPIKGMKIGVINELDLAACDKAVEASFNETLQFLKDEGTQIVPLSVPNILDSISTYYIIAMAEASSNLSRYDGIRYGQRQEAENLLELYRQSRSQGFGDEVKLRILLGTFVLSAGYYDAYYGQAKKLQKLLQKQLLQALSEVDAIALPVSPSTAFKIGEKTADPIQMYLTDIFTVPANLSGIPGICVPTHTSQNNLPIGFQLIADRFAERKLLSIAAKIETHWPPAIPANFKQATSN